ncbi:MAG: DUF1376 domain-containing protein [Rhodopila sp.]|nr:DUF1376 domain-containing protein [Rhodopila sp.]
MSRADAWMPLYIADYLADTMRLTTEEHGAYLLLLMEYWRQGPLPDDDRELSSITKVDRKTWDKTVGPAVKRYFQKQEDGMLHQKRIDAERTKASEISQKRRNAVSQRADRNPSPATHIADKTATNDLTNVDHLNTHARVAVPSPSPLPSSLRSEGPELSLVPANPRDEIFREGVAIVRDLTGMTDGSARSFIGGLLKDRKDDCAPVLAAIRAAKDGRPLDPKAWITRACKPRQERPAAAGWLA